jgi:hypothetical protein
MDMVFLCQQFINLLPLQVVQPQWPIFSRCFQAALALPSHKTLNMLVTEVVVVDIGEVVIEEVDPGAAIEGPTLSKKKPTRQERDALGRERLCS